jgi:hypothetical protein
VIYRPDDTLAVAPREDVASINRRGRLESPPPDLQKQFLTLSMMASARTAPAPTPRRMAEHLLVSKPGSTSSSKAPSTWAFAAFNVWFCSITRSRKPDKLSGFAMSFLCGIKYLAQKKPDSLSGFLPFSPIWFIAGYQPAPLYKVSFFQKTQKPNINVRFCEKFC